MRKRGFRTRMRVHSARGLVLATATTPQTLTLARLTRLNQSRASARSMTTTEKCESRKTNPQQ